MKLDWKSKMYLTLILIGIGIAYPFFAIKYFDTFQFTLIFYHYFLIPTLVLALIATYFLQFKYFKKIEKKMALKPKSKFQDISVAILLLPLVFLVLYGLTLSSLITTNAYLGTQRIIFINQPVTEYEPFRNKAGKLIHYITFKNPIDNSVTRLNASRKYEIGEIFSKEMQIGRWGKLYSFK
jgi:signal transduction histidine kinase